MRAKLSRAMARAAETSEPSETSAREADPVPLGTTGEERFHGISEKLPKLLHQLRTAREWRQGDPERVPRNPGIYLFTRNGRAAYVGQTRNLRQRLAHHAGAKASHNQATYAFSLALEAARRNGLTLTGSRAVIARDLAFAELFRQERERVASMPVRFVTIEDGDPELMTVFEVYAAVMLGTGQSFRTH